MVQPKVARTMFGYNAGPMTKLNRNGYYGANYNPSIFSMPYSPARYAPQMPMPSYNCSGSGTNFWQVLGGLASLAAIALPFMMLFKSFGGNSTGNGNTVEETKPEENNTALTGLDEAVDKADDDGDWKPVKAELDKVIAEKQGNETKIKACDSAITAAEKTQQQNQEKIKELENGNKTLEDDIKKAETDAKTSISTCEEQINAQMAIVGDQNATPDQKAAAKKEIVRLNKEIEKIKENLEKTKAQKNDEIKKNNKQIEKLSADIKKSVDDIKAKKKEKADLEKTNVELDSKIKEVQEKLNLHLGEIEEVNIDQQSADGKTQQAPTIEGTETSLPELKTEMADPAKTSTNLFGYKDRGFGGVEHLSSDTQPAKTTPTKPAQTPTPQTTQTTQTAQTQQQLAVLNQQKEAKVAEIEKCKAEISSLKLKLSGLGNDDFEINAEIDELTSKQVKLNNELNTISTSITNLDLSRRGIN